MKMQEAKIKEEYLFQSLSIFLAWTEIEKQYFSLCKKDCKHLYMFIASTASFNFPGQ